jgi:hypothetical protein
MWAARNIAETFTSVVREEICSIVYMPTEEKRMPWPDATHRVFQVRHVAYLPVCPHGHQTTPLIGHTDRLKWVMLVMVGCWSCVFV